MKYDERNFNSSVEEYKKVLGKIKAKSFLIVFDIKNEKAFFSIAPLSRAIHELDADINVLGINKKSDSLEALYDVWDVFKENKKVDQDKKTKALMEFVDELEKRKKDGFKILFESPDFILEAKEFGFEGSFTMPFKHSWFKKHRVRELDETCKKLWKDVYNLNNDEKVSIGFALIQKEAIDNVSKTKSLSPNNALRIN